MESPPEKHYEIKYIFNYALIVIFAVALYAVAAILILLIVLVLIITANVISGDAYYELAWAIYVFVILSSIIALVAAIRAAIRAVKKESCAIPVFGKMARDVITKPKQK